MNEATIRAVTASVDAQSVAPDHELDRWRVGGVTPSAVVTPKNVDEVSAVLRAARDVDVHVLPLGGRTHVGAVRPARPFVALSTARLAGVEIYEPGDLTLTAASGTTFASLSETLAAHGQWLPCDPPRAPERTLGGLIATGSASPLWAGYGALRDHVLGIGVVTGDGRVLKLGGRVMKNVAGFDLVRLMVGSRGTLGVVVSACVRVFPTPAVDRLLVRRAPRAEELSVAAAAVVTAPVMPVSAVLAEPEPGGGAALVVRLHGARGAVDTDQARLEKHVGAAFDPLEGASAVNLSHHLRDHAFGHPMVLRLAALPSRLSELLTIVRTLPHAVILVDVMSGRVRVGMPAVPPRAVESVSACRRAVRELGGTLVIEAAPADVAAATTVPPGEAADLIAGLRASLDPQGTLWHEGAFP